MQLLHAEHLFELRVVQVVLLSGWTHRLRWSKFNGSVGWRSGAGREETATTKKKKIRRWMFPSAKQPQPLLRDPEVLMRLAGHRVGRHGLRHVISPLSGRDNSTLRSSLRSALLLETANENLAWNPWPPPPIHTRCGAGWLDHTCT